MMEGYSPKTLLKLLQRYHGVQFVISWILPHRPQHGADLGRGDRPVPVPVKETKRLAVLFHLFVGEVVEGFGACHGGRRRCGTQCRRGALSCAKTTRTRFAGPQSLAQTRAPSESRVAEVDNKFPAILRKQKRGLRQRILLGAEGHRAQGQPTDSGSERPPLQAAGSPAALLVPAFCHARCPESVW